ncbi:MAG: radical SAM family heme chaperone HemW [Bacteroidaceae bacterium]|nr:radical SAM family heme chaperone HemW [Bacteroidaceae bacterium]
MTSLGLYIHIPFCRSRCIYCDFYSTTLPETWQMRYVEALRREMEMVQSRAMRLSADGLSTLYIGGGTPSLLSPHALRLLFEFVERNFTLQPQAEVTIEANPDDVTAEWVSRLRDTPVNRISMGVQSLDDDILRTLRRRHTAGQARQAVGLLHRAGYTNLSMDLIYGLPGQTRAQFGADVREVLSMGVPHLSAYALQFEEGTPLAEMKRQGTVDEADEELSLSCYLQLLDLTQEAGLEHYEISNFARPGFHSRHNSSYWTGAPYLGLGAGAHSYDGERTRSFNCADVRAYVEAINQGRLPSEAEVLSEKERYDERVMLSLRTSQGLSLTAIGRDFGPAMRRHCECMAQPHLHAGRLQKKPDETLCLTRQGLFVSDDIISDLMA